MKTTGGSRNARAPDESAARKSALRVLTRVREGREFLGEALDSELRRVNLSDADRRLVTELCYGVLRRRLTIDHHLALLSHRPLERVDPELVDIMRLGAYQILYLSRIPEWAAVSQAVIAARHLGPGAASFANALLRNLARARDELPMPDRDCDPAAYLALVHSHPEWLVRRWLDRYGASETEALCRTNNEPSPVAVRVNTLRTNRPALSARLREAGLGVRESRLVPEGLVVEGGGPVDTWPGYADGEFYVQDESSMAVARALSPAVGSRVIDACAAPGGKATHLAQLMEGRGEIVANDVRTDKLGALKDNLARLGTKIVTVRTGDAARLGDEFPGWADAVLVDAPCTGLGVAGRRPDVRWRVRRKDLQVMPAKQLRLLLGAAGAVRPGGVLVYSVCSLEPEEGDDVVRSFLGARPEFVGEDPAPWIGEAMLAAGEATANGVTLLPHRHGSDGFFIARLRRRG